MLEIVFHLAESELTLEDVLSFASYARDPLTRTAIVEVETRPNRKVRVLVAYVVYGGYRVTDTDLEELVAEAMKK